MDLVEAIQKRMSIRAFKPDPIPRKILEEIMELALRAPSFGNIQPWEFAVVGGKKLGEIRQAITESAGEQPNPDLPQPIEFPESYMTRRRVIGRKMFEIKGIGREDKEKRKEWEQLGLRLFEAPNVILIYTERSFCYQGNAFNAWPVFDCGLVAENIMLLAAKYGLGTIAQIQAVFYPEVLRKVLGIPDSKFIIVGISIGYPNWDDPINQFRSERAPLAEVANWYGFD